MPTICPSSLFLSLHLPPHSLFLIFLNFFYFWGEFFSFFYYIQHCFICRPSDSTVPKEAGIEPRTVATGALAVRRSNHSARSHPPCLQQEWSRPWSCWTWSGIGSPTSPPPSVSWPACATSTSPTTISARCRKPPSSHSPRPCRLGGFNFILFWNFNRNQTENDRYWQKNNYLLLAFAFIVCKKCCYDPNTFFSWKISIKV